MTDIRVFFAVLLTFVFLAQPAVAACKQTDPGLAGGYELQGVMETGSMIALTADGRFRYMLTVGAFDEFAEGCWQRSGDSVVLSPIKIRANDGNPTFKKLELKLNTKGGLVRFYQGKRFGAYVRVTK